MLAQHAQTRQSQMRQLQQPAVPRQHLPRCDPCNRRGNSPTTVTRILPALVSHHIDKNWHSKP